MIRVPMSGIYLFLHLLVHPVVSTIEKKQGQQKAHSYHRGGLSDSTRRSA